jgi:signal transduction histidine kinase
VQGETLPLRGSLIGQAVSTRATVTSADVRVDARFARPDLARRQGWTSALIVPLLAHESEPVGAFSVYGGEVTDQSLAATDWDSKVLTILGHYAALAVRNAANQAALRAAQEQHAAAETFAAVGDVAANLLHNLNNKLGSIPVRVEGIEDKSAATLRSDPYLSAHLREIERSAREALDIVRNSLAHLQSAPLAPVSIQECVSETLASFHVPAGVRVHVTGLSDLPMVVAGKRALGLAVANLLDNAIDVMNGAGTITITGAVHADQAHISITDTGSGIPPELHARIFELNFSGRRSQRSNKLGFGLWWVRTLMMRLGGGVKVESDGKNGATFTLCLPIGEAK